MTNENTFFEEPCKKTGILLMSLYFSSQDAERAEKSLAELKALAETAVAGEADECEFYILTQCRAV